MTNLIPTCQFCGEAFKAAPELAYPTEYIATTKETAVSDVPETIWAWDDLHHVESNPHNHFATEYRRADLPATDAQALANEKVQALVEALKAAIGDTTWGIDHETYKKARAALAALEWKP